VWLLPILGSPLLLRRRHHVVQPLGRDSGICRRVYADDDSYGGVPLRSGNEDTGSCLARRPGLLGSELLQLHGRLEPRSCGNDQQAPPDLLCSVRAVLLSIPRHDNLSRSFLRRTSCSDLLGLMKRGRALQGRGDHGDHGDHGCRLPVFPSLPFCSCSILFSKRDIRRELPQSSRSSFAALPLS
jgi:hypothetical protein